MRKDKKLLEIARLLRLREKAISRYEYAYVVLQKEYNNICGYDKLIVKTIDRRKKRVKS